MSLNMFLCFLENLFGIVYRKGFKIKAIMHSNLKITYPGVINKGIISFKERVFKMRMAKEIIIRKCNFNLSE